MTDETKTFTKTMEFVLCWPATGHGVCPEVWLIGTVTLHQISPLPVGSNCKSLLGQRLDPCPLPPLSTGTSSGLNLSKYHTYSHSLCEYSSTVVSGGHRFLVLFTPFGSYSLWPSLFIHKPEIYNNNFLQDILVQQWPRYYESSQPTIFIGFKAHSIIGLEERALMETSYLGPSAPKSLTL